MEDLTVKHSYVQINQSFVHLVQYSFGESVIKSPNLNSPSQTNSFSSIATKSVRSTNSSSNTENVSINNGSTIYESPKKLIIFIPGNPGLLGIYHDFLTSLSRMLSSSSKNPANTPTILAISHNNFDHPDHVDYKTEERYCIDENDLNFVEKALAKNYLNEPHHVELQVLNKLIILKRMLSYNLEDCRIIFIGHSIGCYVILKLLQDRLLASAHECSIMIHPALENLALTPHGSTYVKLFNYKLDLVMRGVALIVEKLLPKSAKLAITKWVCSPDYVFNSSRIAIESLMQLVCHKTLYAMIQMAKSEFKSVKNLNTNSLVEPHVSKLKLIYAINDHWVNPDNRKKLRELYPDLYMEEQATIHAFVLNTQKVMDYAVKVGLFIQDIIDNIDQTETVY